MDNGMMSHKLVEQRHQEVLREAEMYWNTRQAREPQGSRPALYAPALAALGRTFIAWGEALQTQAVETQTPNAVTQ